MKQLYFIALALLLGVASCKKGEDGAQGAKGEQGLQGVKGEDGTTILSGTGIPSPAIGKTGDFYLDLNTYNFYGPKNASGNWPGAFNLKGNTGATGQPGATILNGTTTPAASLGRVGDFYYNTAIAEFYGPKTATGWGLPVSLKGSTDGVKVVIVKNQPLVRYNDGLSTDRDDFHQVRLDISIDSKYQIYYDNGLALVSLRNGNLGTWSTHTLEYTFLAGNSTSSSRYLYVRVENFSKSSLFIRGLNAGFQPSEFSSMSKNLQVKLVFIPAATVETISANHIDITDANAVSRFLKID